jgi:threonine synthase
MWRYHALLPVAPEDAVTLGEGGSPLVQARRLGAWLGLGQLD